MPEFQDNSMSKRQNITLLDDSGTSLDCTIDSKL